MDRIRCVIADMSHQMLGDIVQNTVEQAGFIDVLERVHDTLDIAAVIARHKADVLILGIENKDFTRVCSDIMNQISDVLIIGLVDDGRRLALLYDDVGYHDIINVIHVLRYPAAEHA